MPNSRCPQEQFDLAEARRSFRALPVHAKAGLVLLALVVGGGLLHALVTAF